MRYSYLFVAILLSYNISLAQEMVPAQKPVLCVTGPNILGALNKQYEEELRYYGKNMDGDTIIEWYENDQTGTWTLVERKTADHVCILGTGERKPGMTGAKKS